jgi:uncharacterized membrane protein
MNNRKILMGLLLVGILISVYLVYVHYNPGALVCLHSGIINCASVITSQYSVVFGVPLAVYSLVWFVAAFILIYFNREGVITEIWLLIGIGGIIYSISSMYSIGEICIYCSMLDVIIALSIIMLFFKL